MANTNSYREVDGVVVAAVIVFVVFKRDLIWFGCFFGLAVGVVFGDLFDRPLVGAFELDAWMPDDNLLIAPVLACIAPDSAFAVKLFCLGGEQPI